MRLEKLFLEAMHPNISKAATDLKNEIIQSFSAAGLTFTPEASLKPFVYRGDIQGILMGQATLNDMVHHIILDLYNHRIGLAKTEVHNKNTDRPYTIDSPVTRWYNTNDFIKYFKSKSKKSSEWSTKSNVDKFMEFLKRQGSIHMNYGSKIRPEPPLKTQPGFHDDDEFGGVNIDTGPERSGFSVDHAADEAIKLLQRMYEPINSANISKVLSTLRIEYYKWHLTRYANKAGITLELPREAGHQVVITADGIKYKTYVSGDKTTYDPANLPEEIAGRLIGWRNNIIQRITVIAMKKAAKLNANP